MENCKKSLSTLQLINSNIFSVALEETLEAFHPPAVKWSGIVSTKDTSESMGQMQLTRSMST